ncbi:hypothetical protein LJC31_05425 [Synergistaceae bacterium OttesenSCG-928-I11]|nr:hypothetical protein [Synergistaceae bacterium OttesenSCG-928-I11]
MSEIKKMKAGKGKARSGFSLVSVLIISIVGVAIMGGIAYMFNTYAGSSRVTIAQGEAYNLLQEGVERGKIFLREAMKSSKTEAPLSWNFDESFSGEIEELETLLIKDKNGVVGIIVPANGDDDDFETVSIGGADYKYTVKIYDMRYTDVPIKNDDDLKATLPPVMSFIAVTAKDEGPTLNVSEGASDIGNAGIYLVRALLEPVDGGPLKMIETAVVQAIDEE